MAGTAMRSSVHEHAFYHHLSGICRLGRMSTLHRVCCCCFEISPRHIPCTLRFDLRIRGLLGKQDMTQQSCAWCRSSLGHRCRVQLDILHMKRCNSDVRVVETCQRDRSCSEVEVWSELRGLQDRRHNLHFQCLHLTFQLHRVCMFFDPPGH